MENEVIYNYVPLWGSWQIEKLLGKGSFGSVYRISKDVYGDKIYSVVKIISIPNKDQYNSAISITGSRDNATLSKYFESLAKSIVNEINLLYTLKGSSNIISFEDHMIEKKSDNLGWDILIRMEQATSLTEYLSKNTLQKKDIIQFGIDICTGLDLCYKKGILHRDIKEDNLFISENNSFKIGDFGVSKALYDSTKAVTRVGTMIYMAPEVFSGNLYDISADLYSLGIVMFKLLNNGRIPFLELEKNINSNDVESAISKRLTGHELPLPKHYSYDLGRIIQKACAFRPEARFRTPIEFITALRSISNNELSTELNNLNDTVDSNSNSITNINQSITISANNSNSFQNNMQNGNVTQENYVQHNSNNNISQNDKSFDNNINKSTNNDKFKKTAIIIFSSISVILILSIVITLFIFINNNKENKIVKTESDKKSTDSNSINENTNSTTEPEITNALYIDDQASSKCFFKLGTQRKNIEEILSSKEIKFKFDDSKKILTCSQYNVESILMAFDTSNKLNQIMVLTPKFKSLKNIAVEDYYSYDKFGCDYESKIKSKTEKEEDIFEYIYVYSKDSYSIFYSVSYLDEINAWGVINKSAKDIKNAPSLVNEIKSKY